MGGGGGGGGGVEGRALGPSEAGSSVMGQAVAGVAQVEQTAVHGAVTDGQATSAPPEETVGAARSERRAVPAATAVACGEGEWVAVMSAESTGAAARWAVVVVRWVPREIRACAVVMAGGSSSTAAVIAAAVAEAMAEATAVTGAAEAMVAAAIAAAVSPAAVRAAAAGAAVGGAAAGMVVAAMVAAAAAQACG